MNKNEQPKALRAYRVELYPTNKQRSMFLQYAGTARHVYNWGLERKIEEYEKTKKSLSAYDLMKELVQLKHSSKPWLWGISKCVPENALFNLDEAFKSFFRRVKAGQKKLGFPKFKNRNHGFGGFKLNQHIIVTSSRIKLPRIGWVGLKRRRYIPNGKYKSASITEQAGHWFVSVLVEQPEAKESNGGTVIGVDLGINHLAVTSEGEVFDAPKPLKKKLDVLRCRQRKLSRKQRGSRNREKAKRRLAALYYKIACVRKNALHELTSRLAKNHSKVVIEDLNVQGMMGNRCLSRAISDMGWGEFRRQLGYKCRWYGSELVIVDRFFPSSKTCSGCGHKKESLALSEREFRCEGCGMILDRDLNAAVNLRNAGGNLVSACGGMSALGSPDEAGIWQGSDAHRSSLNKGLLVYASR